MAVVNINILGNNYQIACDDGQEDRLKSLASKFNNRLNNLSKAHRNRANANLLLVMAALTLEDEVSNNPSLTKNASFDESEKQIFHDITVSNTIEAINDYIENIANKLEKI